MQSQTETVQTETLVSSDTPVLEPHKTYIIAYRDSAKNMWNAVPSQFESLPEALVATALFVRENQNTRLEILEVIDGIRRRRVALIDIEAGAY